MSNYKAIIAKIDAVVAIEGADKIQIAKVLGESVIVAKDWSVGKVGVFFPAGTQLSELYCKENSLYRDSTMNANNEKKGFFENSRRVRAQPFLKVRSEGYFAELESLACTGADLSKLVVGDNFEELNGVAIATKFINEKTRKAGAANNVKQAKKNYAPMFTEHVDTQQFRHNVHKIEVGDLISIQSKKHGTSVRYAYTEVQQDLTKFQQFVNRFLPVFAEKVWDYVCGTRRVVLRDAKKEGFHGSEQYRYDWLEKLKPYMTKGMAIYGEIVGYANDKPIMAVHGTGGLKDKAILKKYGPTMDYKYGCPKGTNAFHIYRISYTTADGVQIDMTQSQLVRWCKDRGFEPSYDLVQPFVYTGKQEELIELVERLTERPDVLTEDYHDPSHISEGVIIRVDRDTHIPLFLKNKSYLFRCLEGICEEVDVEDIS